MSTPRSLAVPGGVRRATYDAAGTRFAALETASRSSADHCPVVLLPGWTGSKEDLASLLPFLGASGFDAVVIDQRGQFETPVGKRASRGAQPGIPDSDHPGPLGQETRVVDELAHDVLELARQWRPTADRIHLVGHSFGGLVARATALAAPSRIASVTLVCSGPASLPDNRHAQLRLMARSLRIAGSGATWQLKNALDDNPSHDDSTPPAVMRFLRRRFLRTDPTMLAQISLALTHEPDRVAELARSRTPVLVVIGEDDDGWPTESQHEMASRLGTEAHVIPAAGHSPAVDNPAATAAAITPFLGAVERGGLGTGESLP